MGQSTPLHREIVFTDASLTVAAARERGTPLDPQREAERILGEYPGSGVTVEELSDAITEMVASAEPAPVDLVSTADASGPASRAIDFPSPGTDGK